MRGRRRTGLVALVLAGLLSLLAAVNVSAWGTYETTYLMPFFNGGGGVGFLDATQLGNDHDTCWWWGCPNSAYPGYSVPPLSALTESPGHTWFATGPGTCQTATSCYSSYNIGTTNGESFNFLKTQDYRDDFSPYNQQNSVTLPSTGWAKCVSVQFSGNATTARGVTIFATALQSTASDANPFYRWPAHNSLYVATYDAGDSFDFGLWDEDGAGWHQKITTPGDQAGVWSDVSPIQVCMVWLPHASQGGTTDDAYLWVNGLKVGHLAGFTPSLCAACANPGGGGASAGWGGFGGGLPNESATPAKCSTCTLYWGQFVWGTPAMAADMAVPCTQDTDGLFPWTSTPGGSGGSGGTGNTNPWYCNGGGPADVPGAMWLGLTGSLPSQVPQTEQWTCYPQAGMPGGAIAMSGSVVPGTEYCPQGYDKSPLAGWTYDHSNSCQYQDPATGGYLQDDNLRPGIFSKQCKWQFPTNNCTSPDGVIGWITGSVPYALCLVGNVLLGGANSVLDVLLPGPNITAALQGLWTDASTHAPFGYAGGTVSALQSGWAAGGAAPPTVQIGGLNWNPAGFGGVIAPYSGVIVGVTWAAGLWGIFHMVKRDLAGEAG